VPAHQQQDHCITQLAFSLSEPPTIKLIVTPYKGGSSHNALLVTYMSVWNPRSSSRTEPETINIKELRKLWRICNLLILNVAIMQSQTQGEQTFHSIMSHKGSNRSCGFGGLVFSHCWCNNHDKQLAVGNHVTSLNTQLLPFDFCTLPNQIISLVRCACNLFCAKQQSWTIASMCNLLQNATSFHTT
jgi:hypothetical protein